MVNAVHPHESTPKQFPLDTSYTYQTPEGIELELILAGPLVRSFAWLVDFSLRLAGYLVLVLVLSWLGGVGRGLILMGIFVIEWFYPVIFEATKGATPGKKLLGLEVVLENGTPVGWTGALIRNLLRAVDFLPFFNALGLVTTLVHSRFQRLGDLAAGTLVVYRHAGKSEFAVPEYPSRPTGIPLRLPEQRLILDFCERKTLLSDSRSRELALLLPHLTSSKEPELELLAYGNWYIRGRNEG